MEDLDEEARARRRKEQIEYRNKKRFSNIFMIGATLFNIVETFVIIIALLVLGIFILTKTCNPETAAFSNILGVLVIVLSFGGLVLGFLVYKKVTGWVIKRFNLEDKLLDSIKMHYQKKTKEEKEAELKR